MKTKTEPNCDALDTGRDVHNISGRKIFLRLLWMLPLGLLVFFLIFIFTFYAVTNHRGAEAWREAKAELDAANIALDIGRFIPEMPPDEENFAMAEVVRNFELPRLIIRGRGPSWLHGSSIDFTEWAESIRESGEYISTENRRATIAEIFALTEKIQGNQVNLLLEASRSRPASQLTIQADPNSGELNEWPYFSPSGEFRFGEARGCAAIALGDSIAARHTIEIILRFADLAKSSPTMMGQLHSLLGYSSALEIIWFGFETECWQENDLVWIADVLSEIEILPSFEKALEYEIVFIAIATGNAIESPNPVQVLRDISYPGLIDSPATARLIPAGWWNQFRASQAKKAVRELILPLRENDLAHFFDDSPPEELDFFQQTMKECSAPFLEKRFVRRAIFHDTSIRLARSACAVELYRLENDGRLPPADFEGILEDPFVPGNRFRFVRDESNGRYKLYSVGYNGKDDGGEPRKARTPIDWRAPFDEPTWQYTAPE